MDDQLRSVSRVIDLDLLLVRSQTKHAYEHSMPKNAPACRVPPLDRKEACEIWESIRERPTGTDQLTLNYERSIRSHPQLMLAADAPNVGTNGGDTGGCSICSQSGTIFIDIREGVKLTDKSRIEVRIDNKIEFVAVGSVLKELSEKRSIVLHLPGKAAGIRFPPSTSWLVFLWLGDTTQKLLKKYEDCIYGEGTQ